MTRALSILVFGLLLAACSSEAAQAGAPARGKGGRPPALVRTASARGGQLADRWTFLGEVRPMLASSLAAEVGGTVLSVTRREGDRVKRGELLVRLDPAVVQADVGVAVAREASAAAELAQAERELARVQAMRKQGDAVVTEAELERYQSRAQVLRAQLGAQRAEIRKARAVVGRHELRAPFAGVVAARHVDPGATVRAGDPVLDVVSVAKLDVRVEVPMLMQSQLKEGARATLHLGTRSVEAEVRGVVPALDAATRTLGVRLEPLEQPEWLLAGMSVDVSFPVSFGGEVATAGPQAVLVSADALVRGPVEVRVVRVVDGKAQPVTVEVLATARDEALVRAEGLKPGDVLVVRGNERLRPDQAVRVEPVDVAGER